MSSGDVSMLLNESPGLHVQMTSPGLGPANVRIEGLEGRYSQVTLVQFRVPSAVLELIDRLLDAMRLAYYPLHSQLCLMALQIRGSRCGLVRS
jgi:hypothetical protein